MQNGLEMQMKTKIISQDQARKLIGVGTTKFWHLRKLPDFPKPCGKEGTKPLFNEQELRDWAHNLPPGEPQTNHRKKIKVKPIVKEEVIIKKVVKTEIVIEYETVKMPALTPCVICNRHPYLKMKDHYTFVITCDNCKTEVKENGEHWNLFPQLLKAINKWEGLFNHLEKKNVPAS